MQLSIRNFVKKLPFVRRIVEKLNQIEKLQSQLEQQIEQNRKKALKLQVQLQQQKEQYKEEIEKLQSQLKQQTEQNKEEVLKMHDQLKQLEELHKEDILRLRDKLKQQFEQNNDKLNLLQSSMKHTQNDLQYTKKDIKYYYNKLLSPNEYKEELKKWYTANTGEILDLENPKTYNEKIQWLKLHDSTPIKTQLADKYLVRDWVKDKIGEQYLIPIYGVWDKFEDIDFNKLPDKFVLKANHGCGWNIIVKDKSKFNIDIAKKSMNNWLNTNFAFVNGFELHYKDIMPKIIAEKYIENNNADLYDYKFLCFHGYPKYIWVNSEKNTAQKRDFFDLNWNLQPFNMNYSNSNSAPKKPNNFEQMLQLTRKLCEGFTHVRVDFYNVNEKIYFGEMTFTTGSGKCKWEPKEYDLILGNMLELPKEKKNAYYL